VNVWDKTEGNEFAKEAPITSLSFTLFSFNPSAKIEYPTVGLKKHAKVEDIERGLTLSLLKIGDNILLSFFMMPVLIM